jgi:flagellar hook-associated protein 2
MTAPIGPSSTLSGLVSGLDWRTIVDRIIQVEGRRTQQLRDQVSTANARGAAWRDYRKLADALRGSIKGFKDGTTLQTVSATVTSSGTGGQQPIAATAALGTSPGKYSVEVLQLAQAEKAGSAAFASTSTALGLAGEFFVSGKRVEVLATDSLAAVRDKINAANTGASATKVTASLLSTATAANRLVLTSDVAGGAGVNLADGPTGLLGQLGFVDTSTAIKNPNSAGANSDRFTSSGTAVKTLLGLTATVGPQSVTIGGQAVSIDLSTQSLTTIAANIDALAGVSASVQSETAGGVTKYYIDVRGTTSFVDTAHTLEMLGIVKGGRGAVAQVVKGGVLTAGDASTPATAATTLANLWNGGAASGVANGDTLTITGVRGDGSAVSLTFTAGAGNTVQTLLDKLNNVTDGFGLGTRPATATVDAQGKITLTDGTTGDSQLSLSIVANNQGGGRLDVGAFSASTAGRLRNMAAGADARFRVDGVTVTRASNTVTDAIPGVTLTLQVAEAGKIAQLDVVRASSEALTALDGFVKAYNELSSFVNTQQSVDPKTTTQAPLFSDSTLGQTRATLAQTILSAVAGAAADLATANTLGVSLTKDGKLALDKAKFDSAFKDRYPDVQKFFSAIGTTTDSEVNFAGFGSVTQAGTYAVTIATPATRAAVTGAGFSGTYADDGTADTMSVTDTASGGAATVSLANGMSTAQIVQALNDAFALKVKHRVQTGNTLFSDPAGTVQITGATTLSNVRAAGGAATNVASGDTITFTGTRNDGSSFNGTYTVTNPATETVGDLVSRLQKDFGSTVTVSVTDGKISVEAKDSGPSQLNLVLAANNQGGGSLSFGAVSVAAQGRNQIGMTAAAQGANIALTHSSYGSGSGFSLAYTAGGANGTGQLGIAAGAYAGIDVAGTMGGYAATGTGQQLLGNTGTPVAGLGLQYAGTTARSAGDVTLTLGMGALMTRTLDAWLDTTSGLLTLKDGVVTGQVASLGTRIAADESRLAKRRASLVKQFTRMEQVISKLQTQQSSLTATLSRLA